MKKIGVFITIFVILLLSVLFYFLRGTNLNRFGAEHYYIQITTDGESEVTVLDNGEKMERFSYELPAYNDKGDVKEMTFTSHKNLRRDAYLQLFYKESKGVTSYEEVQEDAIPEKALKQLKK